VKSAEQREMAERPLTPAIRKAIVQDNNVGPDYSRIRVPVLAIYRTTTLDEALKQFPPQNNEQRAALITGYAASRAMVEKWQSDLRADVPGARIVELPGANLYMFLSHEAEVIREIRAFASTLTR
jgi:pimeloyl-ACP methyl ester carboxylesterase